MAANVLRKLLPQIGGRKVRMIAEVRFVFSVYAEAADRIPVLWSTIERAERLWHVERGCEQYHDALWSQIRPVSLEGNREEDSCSLADDRESRAPLARGA